MTVTTLDPNTALIVVDLQAGFTSLPTAHPFGDVVANSVRLTEAFRAKKLPVVLVNVAGGAPGRTERGSGGNRRFPDGWTDLLPELDQQPTDLLVTKHTWGAFHDTGLAGRLRELGVTQVVITGVSTTSGVESTARQAFESGFHVTVATDAVTDLNPAAHDLTLTHIFPKLGETGTTPEILALLA